MAKSGIDVSQWQGTINWSQVKGKIDFALIRAGYGDTLSYPRQIDTQYERNYKECKRLGIPVGVYFYSYARNEAEARREAESCLALIKGKQLDFPVFYDVEELSTYKTGKTNEIIRTFCDVLKKAGWWAGLYIYRSALTTYVNKDIRDTLPLAIAEYGSRLNYSGSYGIWQNSSSWSVPGINTRVDHDYCYVDYQKIIKGKGLNGYKIAPKPAPKPTPKKTVDELAKEVIAGKWSAGAKRKKLLTAAGYNYQQVQNRVNELMKPSKKTIDQLAREVIRGDWGAGEDRRKRLTAAGYDYDAVQNRVNQIMK